MTLKTTQRRLRFDSVNVHAEGGDACRVDVSFTFGSAVIRASSAGPSEAPGPLKAAATAALNAVEQAVGGRIKASLADVDHVNALGKQLIAVLVDVEFEGKQAQLFGSCQLKGDEIDASVKAVLNATNRFVELAMRR
ncbi:MAG TPA: alpha-isopropylmalate synthase regulatory domain-containing protein [Blastocatellia bacterium]|nr:alpha-isopropylmalate synthase regulatory domain-containing protein [Blastocatellia bacterium]